MQIFVLLARAMLGLRNFSNGVVGFVLFTRSMSRLFRNKCLCLSKGDVCVKNQYLTEVVIDFKSKNCGGCVDLAHYKSIDEKLTEEI
jgi:hypothetical protein